MQIDYIRSRVNLQTHSNRDQWILRALNFLLTGRHEYAKGWQHLAKPHCCSESPSSPTLVWLGETERSAYWAWRGKRPIQDSLDLVPLLGQQVCEKVPQDDRVVNGRVQEVLRRASRGQKRSFAWDDAPSGHCWNDHHWGSKECHLGSEHGR